MSLSSRLCVFSKHRDILKFEDFTFNHPATYLPFVTYNFLIMSLLPVLFEKESQQMEKSRLYLLQEHSLTLKILETLVNTVLDVNIQLDENKFRSSVEKLKNSKTLSLELVFPLLLIENYLNDNQKVIYQDKLSSFFIEGFVQDSSDLVPSPTFYKEIERTLNGPELWGPCYWTVTHYAAFVIDQSGTQEQKNIMAALSGVYDLLLPCNFCRYDYRSLSEPFTNSNLDTSFMRPFPITLPFLALEYANKRRLFDFYSILHDQCKDPINNRTKELLNVDIYKQIYSRFLHSSHSKIHKHNIKSQK